MYNNINKIEEEIEIVEFFKNIVYTIFYAGSGYICYPKFNLSEKWYKWKL